MSHSNRLNNLARDSVGGPRRSRRRFKAETIEAALEGDHPYVLNRRDRRAIAAYQRQHQREDDQTVTPETMAQEAVSTDSIRKLSRPELIKIHKAMEPYLEVVTPHEPENGITGSARYRSGMTDEAIAAQSGIPHINAQHVAGVRRDCFGNFPASIARAARNRTNATAAELQTRVEALEHRVAALTAWADALTGWADGAAKEMGLSPPAVA